MNIKIQILEDDQDLARLTGLFLESEGYQVNSCYDGALALGAVKQFEPDLVLLDVMLPNVTGLDICREIRQIKDIPIIMLTGVDDDLTEVAALNKGADDYIVKPTKPHILLARIKANLRRQENKKSKKKSVNLDGLIINSELRNVSFNDQPIKLNDSEFDALWLLAQTPAQIVSREVCCLQLRGFEYDGIDRSVDMRISSLRKKLEKIEGLENRIITVRSKGYMLVGNH